MEIELVQKTANMSVQKMVGLKVHLLVKAMAIEKLSREYTQINTDRHYDTKVVLEYELKVSRFMHTSFEVFTILLRDGDATCKHATHAIFW